MLNFAHAVLYALFLIMTVGASTSVKAASFPTVGMEAGLAMSGMDAPSDFKTSSHTGLATGISVSALLYGNLSLQSEFLYVQRATDLVSNNFKYTVKSDGVEIPLLLKAAVLPDLGPYLFMGPVLTVNLNHRLVGNPSEMGLRGYRSKTFDWAFSAGGGIEIGPLFTSLRYSIGLSPLSDSNSDWRSRAFYLMVGILI